MKPIHPRPIDPEEAAVLKQALLHGALTSVPEKVIRSIDSLRVKGECECGCRSIEFEAGDGVERRVSDCVGFLRTGERVDVIVWGREISISSLEIVDHQGAGELPSSVCSWEEAGKHAS